jgi:hypothetical protein
MCNSDKLLNIDQNQITYNNLFNKQCYTPELQKQNLHLRECKFNVESVFMERPDGCLFCVYKASISKSSSLQE